VLKKYLIYIVEGKKRELLVELSADAFEYEHKGIEGDKKYKYALVDVDKEKQKCEPVYIEIK